MQNKLGQYIDGVSNDDYHSDKEYVSSSQLKKAIHDHGNFRWEMNKPREESKWSKDCALSLGSAYHTMILEPHLMDDEFAFIDCESLNLRTKEDKARLAQMLGQHKGKIVLPNTSKAKLKIMKESLLGHSFARKLIESEGRPEVSGYYEDDFYKIKCRFRPDKLLTDFNGHAAIVDLKTTHNMDTFVKDAKYKYHYDLSAALYIHGHRMVAGEIDVPFYFVVQETSGYYRTAVFKCSDQFLMDGAKKYRNALANVKIARGLPADIIRYQEVDYQEI